MKLERLIRLLEAPRPDNLSGVESYLQNDDLLPVPEEERTWKAWNYYSFWVPPISLVCLSSSPTLVIQVADSFNIKWQAWLAVWVGYGVSACFLVLNAYPGAKHHITFPAYGVQAWIGGECVYTLLSAIWPQTTQLGDKIIGNPKHGLDQGRFLGFILFSLLSLVPIWFPLHQIRHLFTLKAILAPIGGITLFAWCLAKAGGAGPIIHAKATISGSDLGWGFIINLMSCISNMATLITNATDFASRSSKPSNVIIPQLIALPTTFAIVSLFGILIGSSSTLIFGEYIWSPLAVMDAFLVQFPSHATRAGVAVISICFVVAQLGTNIAANSISAGCDLTALLPRFLTIHTFVCALVGFCMCPWILESSSSKFESYLSAYAVFLSSIAGVLISNYWVVAARKIKVDDLYTLNVNGAYRYTYGVNFRAYAAYICGIAINVTGFAGAVGTPVPLVATRIYELSFFTGFFVSAAVYIILNKIFPVAQPTAAECAVVTVGRKARFVESVSGVEQGDEDDKKSDAPEEKTTIVVV
ncbi:hypothetical protein RQP46_010625 [Phenoliferia psychrophenolica]